jgi:hypothetical protein
MNEFTRKAMSLADDYAEDLSSLYASQTECWRSLAYLQRKSQQAEAARSALLAHLEGGEQKWLPIETAPPRLGRILVCGDPHMGRCVASAGWRNETPGVFQWEVANGIVVNPTHWMLLPAAPRHSY